MAKAIELKDAGVANIKNPVIGVFMPGDFRVDLDSRERCRNIERFINFCIFFLLIQTNNTYRKK